MNNATCIFGILTCSLNIYLTALNNLFGTSLVFGLLAMIFGIELILNTNESYRLYSEIEKDLHKEIKKDGTK